MTGIEDYVARIDESCGEERDFIVTFRYDKRDTAVERILGKAKVEKSISAVIFELAFKGVSFRLYRTGKAIFRNLKDKSQLQSVLVDLLL